MSDSDRPDSDLGVSRSPDDIEKMSLPALAHTLSARERKSLVQMISYSEHTPGSGEGTAAHLNDPEGGTKDFVGQTAKFAFLGLVEIINTKHMLPGKYTKENPNPETGTYKGKGAQGQMYAVSKRLTQKGVELARYLREGDEENGIDSVPLKPDHVSDVMPEYE